MKKRALIFGGTGAIGQASAIAIQRNEFAIFYAGRNFEEELVRLNFSELFDAVIWAQGTNDSSTVIDFHSDALEKMMEANTTFVARSAHWLIANNLVANPSQFVVVSSIWSGLGRPSKLNYMVTKSAVSGLIRSLAIDLAPLGVSVNGIAPGPIDSPMTQSQLDPKLVERIVSETPSKKLVTLADIGSAIATLATGKLPGMTGQEIVVDGGWGVSKLI